MKNKLLLEIKVKPHNVNITIKNRRKQRYNDTGSHVSKLLFLKPFTSDHKIVLAK